MYLSETPDATGVSATGERYARSAAAAVEARHGSGDDNIRSSSLDLKYPYR